MIKALAEYTQLILDDKAFENRYCVAHFQHSCDRIALTCFEKYPNLIRYLNEESYYYSFDSDPEDIQDSTTGEALFFLCAMMHPELEEDVKTDCEAIVQFARKFYILCKSGSREYFETTYLLRREGTYRKIGVKNRLFIFHKSIEY